MHTSILVLMILCLLPIICGWISGYYRHKQLGMVDNKHPREQNTKLVGCGSRAVAAQMNAWEALAVYSAALLAVYITQVPVEQYANLTMIFLVLRILHGVFYIVNQDILRSLVFLAGYGICIYMFVLAL